MTIEHLNPNLILTRKDNLPPLTGRLPTREGNEAFDRLCRTVKQEGVMTPILLNPGQECQVGHYRLWAAQAVGLKEVPVVRGTVSGFLSWLEQPEVKK